MRAPDRVCRLFSIPFRKERSVNQTQLYRAVARATGETVELVRQVGFTVLAPLVTEPDEASRWLRRARRRAWFKRCRRAPAQTPRYVTG
jgi:hypothetical protein